LSASITDRRWLGGNPVTHGIVEEPVTSNPRTLRRVRRRHRRFASVATAIAVGLAVAVSAWSHDVEPASAASGYHASTEASIADIQAFWTTAMPAVYSRKYAEIPAERIYPYSASDPPPACGGRGHTPYQEVAGNAFYCNEGDFVAYDNQRLIPRLREQFGDFAVGLVLAHEWGHAVQTRVRFASRTSVYVELQADCFAGAWAQHVASGQSSSLRLSDDDLDHALAGFLELRDPSGVDGGDNGAHGNAFDRVGAFQDGLEGGARSCRDYATNPPEVTEAAFTSYADAAVNGDLPLDDVLPLLKKSLDGYWAKTEPRYEDAPKLVATTSDAPTCPSGSDRGVLSDSVIYCSGTNTINYSTRTLHKAENTIGDLGAGVFVAAAWSSAVQHQLGTKLGTVKARATAECLTGAWAGGVENGTGSRRTRDFAFSPGDLDEVVATFIATDGNASAVNRGSVFTRVSLFRTGFQHGAGACLDT
jgi:predicted metalloprotease